MHVHNEWFDFAEYDLKAAKRLINDPEPLIHPALVLAQQCAEKALKGYLFYKNQSPLKTHDLTKLLRICASFDSEFNVLLADAIELNPHVSTSRYPDSCIMDPDLTTAQILIEKAENIFNFVQKKVAS